MSYRRQAGEPVLLCAEHNERLTSTLTTNGNGGFIELVRPCSRCRSRLYPRVTRIAEPAERKSAAPPASPSPQPNGKKPRGRGGNRHCTKKNAAGELLCIICDVVIPRPSKRVGGRMPVFCEAHKDPRARGAKKTRTLGRE